MAILSGLHWRSVPLEIRMDVGDESSQNFFSAGTRTNFVSSDENGCQSIVSRYIEMTVVRWVRLSISQ